MNLLVPKGNTQNDWKADTFHFSTNQFRCAMNQPISLHIHVRMLSGLKTCTVSILQVWYSQVLSQSFKKSILKTRQVYSISQIQVIFSFNVNLHYFVAVSKRFPASSVSSRVLGNYSFSTVG